MFADWQDQLRTIPGFPVATLQQAIDGMEGQLKEMMLGSDNDTEPLEFLIRFTKQCLEKQHGIKADGDDDGAADEEARTRELAAAQAKVDAETREAEAAARVEAEKKAAEEEERREKEEAEAKAAEASKTTDSSEENTEDSVADAEDDAVERKLNFDEETVNAGDSTQASADCAEVAKEVEPEWVAAFVAEGKSIHGIDDVVADWEKQLGFIREQSLDSLKQAKEGMAAAAEAGEGATKSAMQFMVRYVEACIERMH